MIGNLTAFLDMIAWSEGTTKVIGSDNGYNVLVGGKLFDSYADHPRIKVKLTDTLYSTAAGRYQLLARYFDHYKKLLELTDFSPESQDVIAVQQIKECRALESIHKGMIETAIKRCAHIWASFPGAGYGQREHSMDKLVAYYQKCGGYIL